MAYNIADLFEHAVDAISRSPSGKPDHPWAQRIAREAPASAATAESATEGAAADPADASARPGATSVA
jgi:hypothetical protein